MTEQAHWSAFWNQGHATTFGDFFRDGYQGSIGRWISEASAAWPQEGQLLDLGCGNCGLLTSILELGCSLSYVGVDPAEVIVNERAQALLETKPNTIQLLSGQGAEKVALPDQSTQAAVSIFGFEYAQSTTAIPELSRLLAPGGTFHFLMHHSDSIVTQMSKRALDEYDKAEIDTVIAALTVISDRAERIELSKLKDDLLAEQARTKINEFAAQYLTESDAKQTNVTMFEFMTTALRFFKLVRQPAAKRLEFIEGLRLEYMHYRTRFEQMMSVAKNEAEVREFRELCQTYGLTVEAPQAFHDERGIIAWKISGTK